MTRRFPWRRNRSARRAPLRAGATAALLSLAAGMLGATALAAVPAAAAPVRAQQPWIRWLPANLPAGGYVTLTNLGDQPLALIGASSPDYGSVELHRSLTRNGTSSMVPVARLELAPHATLDFATLGYHLMLMQPRMAVAPGDHVPVTLQFADGRSLTASFEVRKPDAGAPAKKGMADMPGMPGMSH